jgi:hypothetical protein
MSHSREDEAFALSFLSAKSWMYLDAITYVETAVYHTAAYQARETKDWHAPFEQSEDNLESSECWARRNARYPSREEAINRMFMNEALLFGTVNLLIASLWHLELGQSCRV